MAAGLRATGRAHHGRAHRLRRRAPSGGYRKHDACARPLRPRTFPTFARLQSQDNVSSCVRERVGTKGAVE